MTAQKYAELTDQIETLRAQIKVLDTKLEDVRLERILLEDALRVEVRDGATYTAPGKSQTLTVRKEGRSWSVYDQDGLVTVYNYADPLGRALGVWGAVK